MKAASKLCGLRDYFDEVRQMLGYVENQIESFVEILYRAYLDERLVLLIGNGGSAANASHFGQDLNKGALPDRAALKRFRAVPLTDNTSFITALANDEGYESVFVEQLISLGRPSDLLIAISGSGNSRNVLRAVEYANNNGIATVGVTGFDGGALRKMATMNIHVPSHDMGLVEAVHSVIFHVVISQLRDRIQLRA